MRAALKSASRSVPGAQPRQPGSFGAMRHMQGDVAIEVICPMAAAGALPPHRAFKFLHHLFGGIHRLAANRFRGKPMQPGQNGVTVIGGKAGGNSAFQRLFGG